MRRRISGCGSSRGERCGAGKGFGTGKGFGSGSGEGSRGRCAGISAYGKFGERAVGNGHIADRSSGGGCGRGCRGTLQLDESAGAEHQPPFGTREVHFDKFAVLVGLYRGFRFAGGFRADGSAVGRDFDEGIVLFAADDLRCGCFRLTGGTYDFGVRRTCGARRFRLRHAHGARHFGFGGTLRSGCPGGIRRGRRRGSRNGPVGLLGVEVSRNDLMLDDLDDPAALVHHDVARAIDLVDEIAVDEDARQYPAAHE